MGWAGIPLNTATSMISAIAIGIMADDTIHFLSYYCDDIRNHGNCRQAISRTILAKGKAIITTSIALFFAFGILAFSNFVPTVYFGILTAGIMITAVLGDLIILPILLLIFEPKFKSQSPFSN